MSAISVKPAVDDMDSDGGVAAHQTGARKRHVMGETCEKSRVGRTGCTGCGDWHEHHLVPIGVLAHPVGIVPQPLCLGCCHGVDDAADVVEDISVGCRVVGADEGPLVVGQFGLLKKRCQTVCFHHQQCLGSRKVELAPLLIVDAVEYYLGSVDGVIFMSSDDLIDGQGHFSENAGGTLDVGTAVVVHQLADGLSIIGNSGGLENLLSTVEKGNTVDDAVSVVLGLYMHPIIDVKLGNADIGHRTETAGHLEEEAWYHMAGKRV